MRPLDLELLRTFVAITDRESFALAAEQVHRTQSAVTQQMARLEEQLGVALFLKVGRSKRLTEHGVRLLDYARRLLALNDEAIASLAAQDLRGPLRIGSIYDATEFLLPPLLARFSQLYPNLQIEVHTDRTAHLMHSLKRGEIEIALVAQPKAAKTACIQVCGCARRHWSGWPAAVMCMTGHNPSRLSCPITRATTAQPRRLRSTPTGSHGASVTSQLRLPSTACALLCGLASESRSA